MTAMDQAEKFAALSQKVSSLEEQVSVLRSKIVCLEEGNLYMTQIIEVASEQLICKSLRSPQVFLSIFICASLTILCLGTCLDTDAEDCRVSERISVLKWVSADTDTFWSDARRCQAVVRLQDRANHIGEAVEGCRTAMTTMFSVMPPRNPFPDNFGQLLDTFRSSHCFHRLIKLNLIADANFALAWMQKWKPQTDFETISKGFPPHRSKGFFNASACGRHPGASKEDD
jgi:hypothetical protein